MFKFSYHCAFNSDNSVVTLSPTKSTYAKAFLPSIVFAVGVMAIGAIVEYRDNKELDKISNSEDD